VVENTVRTDLPSPKYRCGITLNKTIPLPVKTTIFGNSIRPAVLGDIELNGIAVAPEPANQSPVVPHNYVI
jgi:hypothetical protein